MPSPETDASGDPLRAIRMRVLSLQKELEDATYELICSTLPPRVPVGAPPRIDITKALSDAAGPEDNTIILDTAMPPDAETAFLEVCAQRCVALDAAVVWAMFVAYAARCQRNRKPGWTWRTRAQMLATWRVWVNDARPFGKPIASVGSVDVALRLANAEACARAYYDELTLARPRLAQLESAARDALESLDEGFLNTARRQLATALGLPTDVDE